MLYTLEQVLLGTDSVFLFLHREYDYSTVVPQYSIGSGRHDDYYKQVPNKPRD